MTIKKKVILLAACGLIASSCASGPSVKRAEQSLQACTVELVELDRLTMEVNQEPLSATWLEGQYLEVNREHGEGQGHVECLSNIDSLIDWLERSKQ